MAIDAHSNTKIVSIESDPIGAGNLAAKYYADALSQVHESPAALALWDTAFTELQADLEGYRAGFSGAAVYVGTTWKSATEYQWPKYYKVYRFGRYQTRFGGWRSNRFVLPTTRNGFVYILLADASAIETSGNAEPSWPMELGQTVVDGSCEWVAWRKYWEAGKTVAQDDVIEPYNGRKYIALNGGVLGASEPNWPIVDDAEVVDGAVTWRCVSETDTTLRSPASAIEAFAERYRARKMEILAKGGIVPPFNLAGTSEPLAQQLSGACWQDQQEDYWWVAAGTDLLPAFTNYEYVTARYEYDDEGFKHVAATHEFRFVIKVACPSLLAEGDKFTITIGNAGLPETYRVGDKLHLALVAASPLQLGNGVDGDDSRTWSVRRSVDGPGATYTEALDSPALYDDGQVQFRLNTGGVDNQVGDQWTWCVSSDTFKHRLDGGAWSADLPIGLTVLADGLSVVFQEGACPSFVAGDSTSFQARQPYSAESLRTPADAVCAWDGDSVVITTQVTGDVDAVGLLLHDLPSTAQVVVSDGGGLNLPLTWRDGPMVALLDSTLTDPTLTWTITGCGAAGGEIRYLWAGEALAFEASASTQRRQRRYRMQRGRGINGAGRLIGAGNGLALSWRSRLREDDVDEILNMADHTKAGGDWPVCVVPVAEAPERAHLVRLADAFEWGELRQFQGGPTVDKLVNMQLEFSPWLD